MMTRRAFAQALAASIGVAGKIAHAADRLKINVVNTSGNTNVVLATLLKQEGIFEQLGLDANILHVSDGSKLIGSLLSGEVFLERWPLFVSLMESVLQATPPGKAQLCVDVDDIDPCTDRHP